MGASEPAAPDGRLRAIGEGRRSCGRLLAARLATPAAADTLVLGVARGGVVVAEEVARERGWPLDVLVVHRLAEPDAPHLSLGAVAEPGHLVVHRRGLRGRALGRAWLRAAVAAGRADAARRAAWYRGDHPRAPIAGRRVIVVDDAAGTGAILGAAVRAVRALGAREVVVAVPVAPAPAVAALRRRGARVVRLADPAELIHHGLHYPPPGEVTDAEVRHLLAAHAAALGRVTGGRGAARDGAG